MTRSDRMIARFDRRRRLVLGALGITVALGFTLVLWSERDYRTFGRSFGDRWTQWHDFKTYRAIDDDPYEMFVYVRLVQRPAWMPHEMYIGLGHLGAQSPFSAEVMASGDPHITMRVPVTQVRRVLRHGPPEHVIDRLREAALAAQWVRSDWWGVAERRIEVAWNKAKR